jgi:nucleoid DNA-binding protein
VTKKGIVKDISDRTGLTQVDAKRVVQATFDSIIELLEKHGRIEIRNFGVFAVRTRAPRKARNPRTGEEVMVPEKRIVTFKPGRIMEQQIH